MARALIHHEGPLGELLSLVESIERAEVDKFESRLESHGLDLEALQALEHEAYDWVHGLLRSEP